MGPYLAEIRGGNHLGCDLETGEEVIPELPLEPQPLLTREDPGPGPLEGSHYPTPPERDQHVGRVGTVGGSHSLRSEQYQCTKGHSLSLITPCVLTAPPPNTHTHGHRRALCESVSLSVADSSTRL